MDFIRGMLNPLSKIARPSGAQLAVEDAELPRVSSIAVANHDYSSMSRQTSSEIASLVEDMNETAGKSSPGRNENVAEAREMLPQETHDDEHVLRRSPRKRPSPQALGPSPEMNKRRRTANPPTSSGRLKRKSLASQTRLPKQNRDSYEIQVEDSDGAGEAESAWKAPLAVTGRKPVRLLKKKAANPSPLKGQGEVEIPATSKVNVDDSPAKKPVGRPKKVEIRHVTNNHEGRAKNAFEADRQSPSARSEASDQDETPARPRTARNSKQKRKSVANAGEQTEQAPDAEASRADRGTAKRGKTQEEQRKEREQKREKDRATELKDIERISNMHGWGCNLAWGDVFAAITELTEMRNSVEPESKPGTRLCRRIHWLADRYRPADEEPEYAEEDLLSIGEDIQRLAKSVWRYPENRANAPNERAKKGRDLYGHILPDLVRLLRKVLHNRQKEGRFEQEDYNEMCSLLEASWNAADLACKWQPRPSQLDNGVLRLMRDDVRRNLAFLKEKYLAHREDYAGMKEEQTLDDVAKVQKKAHEHLWGPVRQRRQEIQNKNRRRVVVDEAIVISEDEGPEREIDDQGEEQALQETNEAPDRQLGLLTPPSEPEILDNFHALQKKNQEAQDKARNERRNAILNKNRWRPVTTGVAAATEQAILDIDDIPSPSHSRSETTPTPARGDRAHTEEIPAPVQPPVWTEQERIVFQNLLQRFTGPRGLSKS